MSQPLRRNVSEYARHEVSLTCNMTLQNPKPSSAILKNLDLDYAQSKVTYRLEISLGIHIANHEFAPQDAINWIEGSVCERIRYFSQRTINSYTFCFVNQYSAALHHRSPATFTLISSVSNTVNSLKFEGASLVGVSISRLKIARQVVPSHVIDPIPAFEVSSCARDALRPLVSAHTMNTFRGNDSPNLLPSYY